MTYSNNNVEKLADSIFASQLVWNELINLSKTITGIEILNGEEDIETEVIKNLILWASVLAFSEQTQNKRLAQLICALVLRNEHLKVDPIIDTNIQIIISRLGNIPAIEYCQIFKELKLTDYLKEDSHLRDEFHVDSELLSELSLNIQNSRYQIGQTERFYNVYQHEIQNALDTFNVVSISAPTSFGKSLVVKDKIVKSCLDFPDKDILIIVPSKALIDMFVEDLNLLKKTHEIRHSIVSHRPRQDTDESRIYVLTQERANLILNFDEAGFDNVSIVYVDEAHNVAYGYRGFLLSAVIRRIALTLRTEAQYIFTTPVLRNPDYFYKCFFYDIFGSEESFSHKYLYSPVEKITYLISKGIRSNEVYVWCNSNQSEKDGQLKLPLAIEDEITTGGHFKIVGETQKYSENISSYIPVSQREDVSIIKNLPLNEGVVIYQPSINACHQYAIALASVLPNRTMSIPELSEEIESVKKYLKENFHESFPLTELLSKGVCVHHGTMPVELRRKVVDMFERGVLTYLVCTSTLLEGINLPIKTLVLTSNKYTRSKHSILTFNNLTGRTGRLKYELSGALVLIGEKQEEYKEYFVDNEDSSIVSPEAESFENDTKRNHLKNALIDGNNEGYLKAHTRNDIEYLIYEIFTSSDLESYIRRISKLNQLEKEKLIEFVEKQKSEFSITIDQIKRNPGIDPRNQNALFLCLRRINEENPSRLDYYLDLMMNPRRIKADQIAEVISLINDFFYWPVDSDLKRDNVNENAKEIRRISGSLVSWMNEVPFGRFVDNSLKQIELLEIDEIEKSLKKVESIKNQIQRLDRDISFQLSRYLRCFYNLVIDLKGDAELFAKLDSFIASVETGVSNDISRYLYEKGISRSISIKVHETAHDLGMDLDSFSSNWKKLESQLGEIAWRELKVHMS